jgi:spermidine/putrescine transport system permease protein
MKKFLEGFGAFLVYAFLFLPMVVLVVLSFNTAKHGIAWEGFTLDWYSKLMQDDAILEALSNSIEIAFLSTVLSIIMGTAVGMTMMRVKGWKGTGIKKLATLPILLPEIVQGLSLLCFFVLFSIPLGKFTVVIAHASFGTAYVASLVRASLKSMSPMLEEAAADLGANEREVFMKVTLPQLVPALTSGALMVFTLSFDDFIISFFTAGVGATTLPLKIYSMLKFGVTPEVNALSALILMLSFILVTLAFWRQNKNQQEV